MSFRDEEIFEEIGAAKGGRREFFDSDGYSFNRLSKIKDEEFEELCRKLRWRKFAKRWWANATPEQKARVYAYRQQWAREHWGQVLESSRKAKKKRRSKPEIWAAELSEKKRKRAEATQRRRAELIYTCEGCGVQWCQLGRIPSRPPKWCTISCSARANYLRGKAAGKSWAMRTKEFRRDRDHIEEPTGRVA